METKRRVRVLVAPLDWGLGHATRCIPIINQLLHEGCEVILASSGQTKSLLEQEFPGLRLADLPGYQVKYSPKGRLNPLKIFSQIPKILIQIKLEKKWLDNFIATEKPDFLLSDNRYGLYSKRLFSVFMTHQLYIITPLGKSIARLLSVLNYRYINRFSVCWVPDFAIGPSFSGRLGHPAKQPITPVKYIGPLSRFKKLPEEKIRYDFILILSGPEPQRSIFETMVLKQIRSYSGSAILVRGLPAQTETPKLSGNVLVYNHLLSAELNRAICQSEFVISRSGYSTIMDLMALGKKGIMVPTPGQPEQQYLAEYLFEQKIIYRVTQDEFVLQECLNAVKKFPFVSLNSPAPNLLPDAIRELLIMSERKNAGTD